MTSACPTLLPNSERKEKREKQVVLFFHTHTPPPKPLFTDLIANSRTPWGVGYTTLCSWRVAGERLDPTVCAPTNPHLPPTLPQSSSTWYNPFKRLHVISVCAGSSLRAAAHSTFSSAGALTFPSARCAASLLSSLSSLSPLSPFLRFFSSRSLSLSFALHSHTHRGFLCVCECYSACLKRGEIISQLLSGEQQKDRRFHRYIYIHVCKVNCERRRTGG